MKDIDEWMTTNKLKVNKTKTELIVIGSQHRPKTEIVVTLGSDVQLEISLMKGLGLKLVNSSHLQYVIFSHSTNCPYSKIFV